MPRPIQHRDDLRTRLGAIAGWQTARRDDAKVALEVHRTHAIDRICTLDEAAFFESQRPEVLLDATLTLP